MAGIIITRVNGGLGRTLPELDYVSGIIVFNDNKPTEFGTSNTKAYNNLIEVEADGITKDSANYSYEWYHISEYFRLQPDGKIYVHIAPLTGNTYDFSEVLDIQSDANGEIRQLGILATGLAFTTAEIDKVQAHCETLEEAKTPLQVVMTFDYSAILTVADLPDLTALATPARNVSVMVSQDGDAYGFSLSATNNAALGATIGAISLASVQESIGWPDKFNMASTELEVPMLAFGSILYKDLTDTDIQGLNDKGYLYLKKYSDTVGTFFNTDPTADAVTSDYNSIHLNRVYHKALRKIYQALVPLINAPVKLVSGGFLTPGGVNAYESAATKPMAKMTLDGEISDFQVTVPNETNLLIDPTIYINVRMLPVGIAEEIEVTLGFTSTIG